MNAPHRTARSLIFVTTASFAQLIIQFLIQQVLAALFGTQQQAQAWTKVLPIPTMFAAIITGAIGYVLIPELVNQFKKSLDSKEAWGLAWFVGLTTTAIGLLCGAGLWIWSDSIIQTLYRDSNPLLPRLLRILSIQVALTGIITWAQAVHHSRHQFFWPALGGVLGTSFQLYLAYKYGSLGIVYIAWAVNIGSAISIVVHLIPLVGNLCAPVADVRNLFRLLRLLAPLLLGSAFLRIEPMVAYILANHFCVDAATAQIGHARKILLAIIAIGTSGLSLVVFPQLAERFSKAGASSFGEHFSLAFRRLLLLVVPITIGVSCFATWIVRDLLQRDQFTSDDSRAVGMLIVGSMGMFVGASAGDFFARAFYVLGDTKTPTFIGITSLVIGFAAELVLVQPLGAMGIVIGASIYFMLSATIMAVILVRKGYGRFLPDSLPYLLQATTASSVACGFCYVIYILELGVTWVAAPVGVTVYFFGLIALGNTDVGQFVVAVRNRISPEKQP